MGPPSLARKAWLLSYYCTRVAGGSFPSETENCRMPKKFKGTNSKAEEARARKEAVRVAEKDRKQREEEDRYWEDNDKHVLRKQQRKVCVSSCAGKLLQFL